MFQLNASKDIYLKCLIIIAVQINRYWERITSHSKGHIYDRLHEEEIVTISTRNKVLTEKLIGLCMDYLNEGLETNDKRPLNKAFPK